MWNDSLLIYEGTNRLIFVARFDTRTREGWWSSWVTESYP